jgi:hypothetical protein
MIRKVVALPFVYLISRVVWLVGAVGRLVNPGVLFAGVFDRVIGFERAARIRDEHKGALVDAVAAREMEYPLSKRAMVKQIREQHQKSTEQITRGESMVSISIALIALFVKQVPAIVYLPFGFSLPLPSLNTLLLVLTTALVSSVFFRQTAIKSQAFTDPSVFDSYDELMTQLAWNGGTLARSRVGFNLLSLQLLREFDEQFYQLYLEMAVKIVEENGISRTEALKEFGSDAIAIVDNKFS